MIVVVIIGILAAVAIPSYQGFQKRAKGSEAKVILSAIYSSEAAYKAEHNEYGNLSEIGVELTAGKYYTKIGFKKATVGGTLAAAATVTGFIGTTAPTGGQACEQTAGTAGAFQACTEGTDVTSWSIDQAKALESY